MTWDIGKLNKGKSLSDDIKLKISLKKKQQFKEGKLKLPDNRGKIPWNVGTPRTKEEKQVISKAIKESYIKGRKPWNFKRKWTIEEKKKFVAGAKKMWLRRKGK